MGSVSSSPKPKRDTESWSLALSRGPFACDVRAEARGEGGSAEAWEATATVYGLGPLSSQLCGGTALARHLHLLGVDVVREVIRFAAVRQAD